MPADCRRAPDDGADEYQCWWCEEGYIDPQGCCDVCGQRPGWRDDEDYDDATGDFDDPPFYEEEFIV